jgi:hypothetical protein
MVQKPPTQGTERDDAAFIDAYERRKAGTRADDVPAEWRAEVEDFVRIHQRLAAEPMPDVSPAVRSIILSAAAEATREPMQQPLFTRLLHFLMRPGPVLAVMTVAALAVAVAVRPAKSPGSAALPDGAVASAPEVAEPPTLHNQPATRAEEPVALGEKPVDVPQLPAAAAPPEVAAAAPQAHAAAAEPTAGPAKPARTIAAHPASLGPAEAQAVAQDDAAKDAKRPQAPQYLDEAVQGNQYRNVAGAVAAEQAAPTANKAEMAKDLAADKAVEKASAKGAAKAPAMEEANNAPSAAPSVQSATPAADGVGDLRARLDKTSDPDERVALLHKLVASAHKSGDAKTEKWATEQLHAAEQVVTRNRAQQNKASAPQQQNQAPAGKAKAGSPSSL